MKGTMCSYRGIYKEWLAFAFKNGFDPLQPLAWHPMMFLGQFKASLFTTVMAAMSWAVLPLFHHMWTDPDLLKVIHGVQCKNPRLPALCDKEAWDPDMVLDLFHTWPDNRQLSLMQLSQKTVTLLLLATARRQIDVVNISLTHCHCTATRFEFIIPRPTKNYNSFTYWNQSMTISRFGDKKVCPYNALCHYLQRTHSMSKSNYLFIMTNSFVQCSTATLRHWVKTILSAAGIDVKKFPVHSTRAASVSKLAKLTKSLDQVLKLGHWWSKSVFFKHYLHRSTYFHKTADSSSKKKTTYTPCAAPAGKNHRFRSANPPPTPPLVAHANSALQQALKRTN